MSLRIQKLNPILYRHIWNQRAMGSSSEDRFEIAFFDVETTGPGQGRAILEFGAILVCPRTAVELDWYSTLVRPADLSSLSSLNRSNGITYDALLSAPTFLHIADRVYELLHGLSLSLSLSVAYFFK